MPLVPIVLLFTLNIIINAAQKQTIAMPSSYVFKSPPPSQTFDYCDINMSINQLTLKYPLFQLMYLNKPRKNHQQHQQTDGQCSHHISSSFLTITTKIFDVASYQKYAILCVLSCVCFE